MSTEENSAPEAAVAKLPKVLLVDDDGEIVEAMRYALEAMALMSASPAMATKVWH